MEDFYLWPVHNYIFRFIQLLLILLYTFLSIISLKKLKTLRTEDNHSVKPLKLIFWWLVISYNIVSVLDQFGGWSEHLYSPSKFRCVTETNEILKRICFNLILVTTIFIIKAVLIMAKGNGTALINWSSYISIIVINIPMALLRFSWPLFFFIRLFNKGFINCDFANKDKSVSISLRVMVFEGAKILKGLYDSYALYEFFLRVMLSVVMGISLWDIGQLMKTVPSLKTLRKYQLKEWSVFILACLVVSSIMAYEAIDNLLSGVKLESDFLRIIFPDFLSQKPTKDFDESENGRYKAIGVHDVFEVFRGLAIGGIVTLLAPCRRTGTK